MKGNNRLYTITGVGCSLLFVIYLFLASPQVQANDDLEAVGEISAMCAGTYALVLESMLPSDETEVVKSRASWWYGFLSEWTGDEAVTLSYIDYYSNQLLRRMQAGESDGQKVLGLMHQCEIVREEIERIIAD